MKSDLFTKAMLAVIAGTLVFMAYRAEVRAKEELAAVRRVRVEGQVEAQVLGSVNVHGTVTPVGPVDVKLVGHELRKPLPVQQ